MKHAIRTATVFAFASFCLCSSAGAEVVTFPFTNSYPRSINDKGQVTGFYEDNTGEAHGFLRQPDGTIATFDVPNGLYTQPQGTSPTGVVNGSFELQDGSQGGFVRAADGTLTTYTVGTRSYPIAVNAKGWAVGHFMTNDPRRPWKAFLRGPSGTVKEFAVRGVPKAIPTAVNRLRTIAGITAGQPDTDIQGFIRSKNGTVTLFGGTHINMAVTGINDADEVTGLILDGSPVGFVRTSDGTFTTFTGPNGSTINSVSGINNAGTIVGTNKDQTGKLHGFIRAVDGTFTTFDPEGSVETLIDAINDKGAITGRFWTKEGQQFDFAGKP